VIPKIKLTRCLECLLRTELSTVEFAFGKFSFVVCALINLSCFCLRCLSDIEMVQISSEDPQKELFISARLFDIIPGSSGENNPQKTVAIIRHKNWKLNAVLCI
jgi:hypothetical protein